MGNSCCRGEAALSKMLPQKGNLSCTSNTEKESLLGNREGKIKITKKQLEDLLGKADVHGMSVDQLLATFINGSNNNNNSNHFENEIIHHQRSWRPVLHTIPEVY